MMSEQPRPTSKDSAESPSETANRESQKMDPLEITLQQLDRAAHYIKNLPHGMVEYFRQPKRTIGVCFPIEMQDGSVKTFKGYRVNKMGSGMSIDLRVFLLVDSGDGSKTAGGISRRSFSRHGPRQPPQAPLS